MFNRNQRGFTLIELLVVIAIIGILSSVVLASLNSARKKGRDARRISDLKQLQLALELYYDANQRFPAESEMYPSSGTSTLVTNRYISSMPVDPSGLGTYEYAGLDSAGAACTATAVPGCAGYVVRAVIEGGSSAVPQGDVDGTVGNVDCADGGAEAYFCVSP
jgi:prepilin-type N-terminal cleavage/methylation domain-containing protein